MQSKKGNVAAVAIIVVIVAITAGVVGYMFAKKSQTSTVQTVATQQTNMPVAQNQSTVQPATQPAITDTQATSANNDTEWQLISGKNGDSCTGLVYSGSKTVKGWYVWDTGYVEKEWMLQIAESDINKFPEAFFGGFKDSAHNANQKLKLIDASPELQKELKSATKDNPKEITLKGYYLYCEGSPVVSVSPATESFKKYIKK